MPRDFIHEQIFAFFNWNVISCFAVCPYRTTPGLFEFFIIEFWHKEGSIPWGIGVTSRGPPLAPGSVSRSFRTRSHAPRSEPKIDTLYDPPSLSSFWGPTILPREGQQEGPPWQPGQWDLTGASMVEETVAEWPVPTSDENLNQPPLGLAVLTVSNQWRCGGDYPGMLRHTDSKQHSEKW